MIRWPRTDGLASTSAITLWVGMACWSPSAAAKTCMDMVSHTMLRESPSSPERPRVLVLPPRVVGDLSEHVRERFEAQIRDGMSRAQFEIVDPPAERRADPPCVDATCVKTVGGALNVRYVVVPHVAEHARNFDIRIEVYDAVSGDVLAQALDRCEVCGTGELETLLADQAAIVARRIELLRVPAPRLIVHSVPPGAIVRVDGVEVGRTPLVYETDAGAHTISIERRGYLPHRVQVDAVDGVDERIDVTMAREAREPRTPRAAPKRGWRVAGAVLVGVGAATAGIGGSLWAIDGRPYQPRCSGDDIDFAGRCRFQYQTATAGIAATTVGVALLATGIGLIIHASRSGRKQSAQRWSPRL